MALKEQLKEWESAYNDERQRLKADHASGMSEKSQEIDRLKCKEK